MRWTLTWLNSSKKKRRQLRLVAIIPIARRGPRQPDHVACERTRRAGQHCQLPPEAGRPSLPVGRAGVGVAHGLDRLAGGGSTGVPNCGVVEHPARLRHKAGTISRIFEFLSQLRFTGFGSGSLVGDVFFRLRRNVSDAASLCFISRRISESGLVLLSFFSWSPRIFHPDAAEAPSQG